ncbi:MAG TPA: nitroreductase family protein [Marmoricola sp.]|jgi:nitroreductase|nr:nitroreductase family protein [Marmoricola sp.]
MPSDAAAAEIHPFLRDRWSTRIFDPAYVLEEGDLARLLEAARWAPSAGNSQPWAFLTTLRGDAGHGLFVETLSRGNSGWVPTASAVLISLYRQGDDEDPTLTYSDYAAYDLGQAVAHLTVQAQTMGLSVHQFAGFDHDRVAEAFGVPAAWAVTTGIAIGRHAPGHIDADPSLLEREKRPRERNELDSFVFGARFGVPRLGARSM